MRNFRLIYALVLLFCCCSYAYAAELSGAYTINSSLTASTTNFKNLNSAITFLVGSGVRSDAGPSNTAPFGVNGPVQFNVTTTSTTTYAEQIIIPLIPGASDVNTITFNGNSNTLQFACNASNPYVIRLQGAKHIVIQNFIIKTTANTRNNTPIL